MEGTVAISTGIGAAIAMVTVEADTFTVPVGCGIKAIGCGLAGDAQPLARRDARQIWRALASGSLKFAGR